MIHVLRNDPAFVKELDFVMERNGELIGQNMFMKTVIDTDDKRTIPVLTMGPYRTIEDDISEFLETVWTKIKNRVKKK